MSDIEVTVTTNPIDVYINSDPTVYVNTATEGIQGPPLDSGVFVQRSETGIFIPKPINPSGNQFLKWNGENWISNFITTNDVQGLVEPSPLPEGRLLPEEKSYADTVFWNGANWVARKIQTNDLTGVVLLTGNQSISGVKQFYNNVSLNSSSYLGLNNNNYTLITSPGSFYLNNIVSYGGYGGYDGYGYTSTPLIEFINNNSFNLYGSGQTAIKFFQKLITGFENISSNNFIAQNTGSFGWFNIASPSQSSRFTSQNGGGFWVTLDRVGGSPENLNIAGNLQVGSGSGIQAQRLYVRGNALITQDLTVNTSGNFVSGLFINRKPVLTGILNSGSGIRLASGTRNNDLILKNISGKNNITVSETGNLINVQLNDTIYAANQLAEINLLSREITNFDFRSAVFNVLPLSNQVYLSDFNLAEEGQEFVPFNFAPGQAFDLTPSGKNGVISLYKETGLISGFIIDSPQILINGTDILDLVSFSGEISNLESMISGLSGYSESTYAKKTELNTLSGIVTGNNYSLTEMINSLSGYVGLNFATTFDLNQTGQLLLNEINSLNQTITGDYATKQYVVDSISVLSGNLTFVNYKYTLASGHDEYEIDFPQPFIQPPRTVMVQMENEQYNIIYAYDVYGITASGFNVKFSDILAEENKLMVLAKA